MSSSAGRKRSESGHQTFATAGAYGRYDRSAAPDAPGSGQVYGDKIVTPGLKVVDALPRTASVQIRIRSGSVSGPVEGALQGLSPVLCGMAPVKPADAGTRRVSPIEVAEGGPEAALQPSGGWSPTR